MNFSGEERYFIPLDVFDKNHTREIQLDTTLGKVLSLPDHYIRRGLPVIMASLLPIVQWLFSLYLFRFRYIREMKSGTNSGLSTTTGYLRSYSFLLLSCTYASRASKDFNTFEASISNCLFNLQDTIDLPIFVSHSLQLLALLPLNTHTPILFALNYQSQLYDLWSMFFFHPTPIIALHFCSLCVEIVGLSQELPPNQHLDCITFLKSYSIYWRGITPYVVSSPDKITSASHASERDNKYDLRPYSFQL